jgi:hypothetical protein
MSVPRWVKIAMVCFLLVSANGCTKTPPPAANSEKPSNAKVEVRTENEPGMVMFDIKVPDDSSATSGVLLYDCTYQAGGKTAKFRLQFKETGRFIGQFPVALAEGKFVAVAGSDNSVLLEDLKKALEAKRVPKRVSRVAELPFDAAILGEKQSRSPSGSYTYKPPGDWTAMKIFLPRDGDDGEVYLNLNPVAGKAEFTIKDSDYGDYLLKQLARVL